MTAQLAFDIDALIHAAEIEAAPVWDGAPLHYTTAYHSAVELRAAYDREVLERGHFGIRFRHFWQVDASPVDGTGLELFGHALTLASVHLECENDDHRLYRRAGERCSCVSVTLHRSQCDGCAWMSAFVEDKTAAAAQFHDHAAPGWRELPALPPQPRADGRKVLAAWTARVIDATPAAWRVPGAPILTARTAPGTAAVPRRSPFGGYDFAAGNIRGAWAATGRCLTRPLRNFNGLPG